MHLVVSGLRRRSDLSTTGHGTARIVIGAVLIVAFLAGLASGVRRQHRLTRGGDGRGGVPP